MTIYRTIRALPAVLAVLAVIVVPAVSACNSSAPPPTHFGHCPVGQHWVQLTYRAVGVPAMTAILASQHPSAGRILANIGQVISYLMNRQPGQPPPPSAATAEFAIAAVIVAAILWHLVKRSLAS